MWWRRFTFFLAIEFFICAKKKSKTKRWRRFYTHWRDGATLLLLKTHWFEWEHEIIYVALYPELRLHRIQLKNVALSGKNGKGLDHPTWILRYFQDIITWLQLVGDAKWCWFKHIMETHDPNTHSCRETCIINMLNLFYKGLNVLTKLEEALLPCWHR